MQPSSTSAAISGPVKDAISSPRVGGAHVYFDRQTLQLWCRSSVGLWKAGWVGWLTSTMRCHLRKHARWTYRWPPLHSHGLMRGLVIRIRRSGYERTKTLSVRRICHFTLLPLLQSSSGTFSPPPLTGSWRPAPGHRGSLRQQEYPTSNECVALTHSTV